MITSHGVHKGRLLKMLCDEFGDEYDEFEIYLPNNQMLVITTTMKVVKQK